MEVLYLDAREEFLTSRYLVDKEKAIELAALQLVIDFGAFTDKETALDLIRYLLDSLTSLYKDAFQRQHGRDHSGAAPQRGPQLPPVWSADDGMQERSGERASRSLPNRLAAAPDCASASMRLPKRP